MHTATDTRTIVATATENGVTISRYAQEIAQFEADREHTMRLREMRAYGFGARESVCG